MLCHTVLHTIDITTNFGMQLVLNTQYLLAKYLEYYTSSAFHSIAHFKANPSFHQAPQQCFPHRWKAAFLVLPAPCHSKLPAGMRMEPSKNTSGWEQTLRGRGEGRGYHKEIKNANHVLNNDLPPKLRRQGFVDFFFIFIFYLEEPHI